jgi:hypothetical protein
LEETEYKQTNIGSWQSWQSRRANCDARGHGWLARANQRLKAVGADPKPDCGHLRRFLHLHQPLNEEHFEFEEELAILARGFVSAVASGMAIRLYLIFVRLHSRRSHRSRRSTWPYHTKMVMK